MIDALAHHIPPFMLVFFRLLGMLIFAPVLGSPVIPVRVRALLMFMFALAVYPSVPAPSHAAEFLHADLFTLAAAVALETFLGLAIGLLAATPIYAAELAGMLMGQQMGIGLASLYDPTLDTETTVLGQLFMYIAITLFIAIGGLEVMYNTLVLSFSSVPVGAVVLSHSPLELFTGLLSASFELALRVSAPVVSIILLETLAAGILAKTMPQLNVLSIGFAVKVILGLVAIIASVTAVHHALGTELTESLGEIINWVGGLHAAPLSE